MISRCSWKSVVLLALVSAAIRYTAIQKLNSASSQRCPAHSSTSPEPVSAEPAFEPDDQRVICEDHPSDSTWRPQVLLLTTTHCGSSFVGQLLKQHLDVFYLYEPLYHSQNHIEPLVTPAWDRQTHVPRLEDLRPLLEDPHLNIKVVQLVRDPRGVLNSRMRTFPDLYVQWNRWQTSGKKPPTEELHQAETLCSNFFSSVSTALSRPAWLRGRYMLLRYEDLSQNPLQKTQEIYDFVGLRMTPDVEAWIQNNTNGTKGPSLGSAVHAERWRMKLRFDIVEHVQEVCERAMRQLGYRDAHSVDELRNFNTSLVLDETFLPFS